MQTLLKKIVLLSAIFSISSITNAQPDPCSKIQGNWFGKFQQSDFWGSDCEWTANANVSQYKEIVRFDMDLSNGTHRHCKNQKVSVSGTCVNARLSLNKLSGSIMGDSIELTGYDMSAALHRK